MRPEEAIEIIKRMFKGTPTTEQIIALDMAYDALGKQIKRKPREIRPCKTVSYCLCPACGGTLSINKDFCEDCGQKIDWR